MKKLILTAAILGLSAGVAAAQTVRMGTEGAYPPYNFIDDNGEVAGFERELGDKLCEMESLDCTWVTNDWDSIIPNLLSGNYDTIMAGMSITAEREKTIDFTQAYYPPAASSYMAMDPGADLKGGVIAAQTGTIQAAHVAETGATLAEYATLDDTIAAVKNGEADAVFADKDALKPFAGQDNMEFVGDDVQLGKGIGIGLRKSDTELKDKFNDGISKLKADGTLNELLKKYFGDDALTFKN
ncbi:amino acid ABC transporter [Thioclava sediminum]|jgi:polar amino acid transport system substrate-binding protein|uniref:Transporter substrate-binding domain-containing protein n=2 Tax=Thioclava TaxID=285107 RepID=A0ABX6YRH3_9RHOB|nr:MULTISPECIES: transporter substrate-binding domain-containing protein [Thioclava]MAQ37332.1 amino acid ABC transporter [Thioclava sp.]OOY10503.1 amino acid ABC transporter [Thioclava sp. F36-7]OOY17958.1 amino acid ABC transporter [Thioclava sp. DLFJ4-1]OOY25471.1 amino acid ABC transporter [Thioclava sediminum]QPZ90447.1 transporter substrate-binding domain-containing protein [Thioclava electrotropha]